MEAEGVKLVGCFHDAPTSIETYTGGRFDVGNPSADDVRAEDVAHALAHIGRYGGHGRRFLSVGAHCIFCHDEAARRGLPAPVRLMCLLHDAGEAYTNDLGRPVKEAQGMEGYRRLSERVQECVYDRFARGRDLSEVIYRTKVKEVDNAVLAAEVRVLMRSRGRGWSGLPTPARISWFKWFWTRFPRLVKMGYVRRLRMYGALV